ncbi:MAG TPA: endonuclease/exonuclease/phosphatase family protein [Vicinamibacterales bacterium]|nr:endonuclease/exonuclease/phosphatase family protein [Vicinamibacterales bacterium]
MKLISWNTNARRNTEAQARALLARRPDIVGLQEVTARSVDVWVEALKAGGLLHVRSTVAGSADVRRGPHAYGVLIASGYPLGDQARMSFPVPGWNEKALSLLIDTPLGELAMHTVHVPNGSANGWAKVEVLEAVFAGVSGHCGDRHTLLCGDFNTPQCELPSGEVVTWAQDVNDSGRVRLVSRILGGSGQRWDTAERNIVCGLQPFAMRDVFRSLHRYNVDACSWVLRQKERERRRRFDHIFASDQLKTISCEYLTAWLNERLSDHAGIEAVFEAGVQAS